MPIFHIIGHNQSIGEAPEFSFVIHLWFISAVLHVVCRPCCALAMYRTFLGQTASLAFKFALLQHSLTLLSPLSPCYNIQLRFSPCRLCPSVTLGTSAITMILGYRLSLSRAKEFTICVTIQIADVNAYIPKQGTIDI